MSINDKYVWVVDVYYGKVCELFMSNKSRLVMYENERELYKNV